MADDATRISQLMGKLVVHDVARQKPSRAQADRSLDHVRVKTFIDFITGLGRENETHKRLLSHLWKKVENVGRAVLDYAGDDATLWMVVEECFNQSIRHDGVLRLNSYYDAIDEATLGGAGNGNFYSEEYDEHGNRLSTDSGYAQRRRNEEWVRFWVRALHKCPHGPTLFYPPASIAAMEEVMEQHGFLCPPKLIRVFDKISSGINNDQTIASEMSRSNPAGSRCDLRQLPQHEARDQLHNHLEKPLHEGSSSDNLVSWTSSLLFAMQYAIYRCYRFRLPSSQVHICVIDPRDFPMCQFIRDKRLIETYRGSFNAEDGLDDIFRLRLERTEFNNGEYLSQGRVSIEGRSCVVTLNQLELYGLYDLYPRLGDANGKNTWSKRVQNMRASWSKERPTRKADIKIALRLAKRCFPRFSAAEMALMFLALKNRRLNAATAQKCKDWVDLGQDVQMLSGNHANLVQVGIQGDEYEPIEVRRYRILLRIFEAVKQRTGPGTPDKNILGQMFHYYDED